MMVNKKNHNRSRVDDNMDNGEKLRVQQEIVTLL
jgi:hypothetical protein